MNNIPFHLLHERSSTGLEIEYYRVGDSIIDKAETLGAHRDDHYIFFVLEQGAASIMIDFNEVKMQAGALYYVLPGQVHHRIKNDKAEGWFLAIDTALIPAACREVFEGSLQLQQPCLLANDIRAQFSRLLQLLHEKCKAKKGDAFYLPVIHALLQTFANMAAGCYNFDGGGNTALTRPADLARQFKRLLTAHIQTVKSPAGFAEMLHVSPSYLSEAVKQATGFPASYWIEQETLIEAKRLLYYTNLTAKEIAHSMGYSDHAYFGRFFRRVSGVTPLAFRAQYRK